MLSVKLERKNSLLPAVPNDSPERDEGTHYPTEIARRRDVEVSRTAVHVDDVIIVGIRSRKSVDQRRRVRLGSADNSGDQVEKIQSDKHDSATDRRSSLWS